MRSYVLHTTFLLTSWSAARQSALVVMEAHVIGDNRDRKSRPAANHHHRCIITGTLALQGRLLSHGIALDLPLGTYSKCVSCLMLFAFG